MGTINRAVLDPFPQNRNVGGLHRLGLALRRLRHQVMRILRFDALDKFALLGMAGNNGVRMAGPFAKGELLEIEPQTRFAHLRIGTMATEAVARQDRLHILVEIQMLRSV
jgi:hypothetical protein